MFTKRLPYIQRTPDPLRPFRKAGSASKIFSPRVFANGVFATETGYGMSFLLTGVDSEGLERSTLNYASKQVQTTLRMLPDDCEVFEHMIITHSDDLPGRPIENPVVQRQAHDRMKFLKANAKFKVIRLVTTLYIPGKVADDIVDFATNSRSAIRRIQQAGLLFEQKLRFAGAARLSPDEVVQVYSYLLNLDRSLITRRAARPNQPPKRLGRVHIGIEGDYLRVGKRCCRVLSMNERPLAGTRPDVWGRLRAIHCEAVWTAVWQRKRTSVARDEAAAVESALGLSASDIWSAVVSPPNPYVPPPPTAASKAHEGRVEKIGSILKDLDNSEMYGEYSLFGLIHSTDKDEIESALPRIQDVISDPSDAGMMEEHRGSVAGFLSKFPGQNYNVRRFMMRGDHRANVSFLYAPYLGRQWSDDLDDEYTLVYETREGTPFYYAIGGNNNTIVLGGPNRGKSLNVNAIYTAAMKHGTKTFIFDQGGSFETNARELGGVVTRLGLRAPRLNFFCVEGSKENIFTVARIVTMMLNRSGVTVESEDKDAIEKAVERVFEYPREARRLKHLLLPPGLRKGMKRWIEGGIYGDIFDNVEDDLQFADLQVFDFASLDEDHIDLLEVEMSWILSRVQEIIRDPANVAYPKHIIIDELYKRMGILPMVSFFLETIKADRKNRAWATLITHSPEDFGDLAQKIKDACPLTMFLGGAFNHDLYKKLFQLNPRELEQLDSLGERELAIKLDGEPMAVGGQGYLKVLRMNLDPAAYVRATTKPKERILREQEGGVEKLMELATYSGSGR
jgi:type IV secretion system protein VirB4